jgi:hypothetical protein
LLDFELPALTCVSGSVTRDGDPVQGAEVHPPVGCSYFLSTGTDGTFCFTAPATTELGFDVWDPLFYESQFIELETAQGGSCVSGGCSEVNVPLAGITCVAGTVRWHDGEPANGIRVSGPAGEGRTALDGLYCVEAPKDREVTIGFDDPVYGYCRSWDLHTGTSGSCAQGGCTPLDPVFPPTSCISGVVSREGGGPPVGVKVCLGWGEMCVEPDPDGRYCLRAPVDESVTVVLHDYVTESWEERPLIAGPEAGCPEGPCLEENFGLPAIACVSGVVSREGAPEEGARVCLEYSEEVCVTSGAGGGYCLPAAADSGVQVRVKDPVLGETLYDYADTASSGSCQEGDCALIDFELRGATCIRGVVREGSEPLEGAEVWNEFGSVFTNEDGQYCLPALSDAQEWIRAGHPADGSEIVRYPATNSGGRCGQGGCTTQNFTFD